MRKRLSWHDLIAVGAKPLICAEIIVSHVRVITVLEHTGISLCTAIFSRCPCQAWGVGYLCICTGISSALRSFTLPALANVLPVVIQLVAASCTHVLLVSSLLLGRPNRKSHKGRMGRVHISEARCAATKI